MALKKKTFAELCAKITKGIVNDINKRRTTRWLPAWANGGHCVNAYTNRLYMGELNILILSCVETQRGYLTSRWLTERQAIAAGGNVRHGERPTLILFGRPKGKGRRGHGGTIAVFNIEQCDGLPSPRLPDSSFEWRFPRIQRLVRRMGMDFRIDGRAAFYHRVEDFIQVPPPSTFFEVSGWPRAVIHELCHATAHVRRLDRHPLDRLQHVAAAREELVVELATVFVLAALGYRAWPVSPTYIKEWLRYAKAETPYLFEVEPEAQRIAAYLLSFDSAH